MKQRSKLLCGLLCLALCLCMVLFALPATKAFAACEHVDANKKDGRCDTCGSLMQDVYLAYTTASLEDKISVNYFLLLSDAVANDASAYIQFTMADGEIIKIPATQSKLIDGYDVFTCQVAAKEMTDNITMQFYYNGQPAFEKDHQYTVRTYAKHIMDNYQDDKTLDLMEKMVNYGAASQIHFGYRADDLANDFLANKPDYSQVTISGFDSRGVQGTEKVKLYSASLLLTSETTLRLFFTAECPITLNGKSLKIQYRGGLCYVDIRGIDAKELDDDVTVMLHDGTPTPVTYNPMAYCQAVQNSPAGSYTDEMQDLVRALYLYNQSSNYYFDNTVTQGANMIDALHYVNADNTTAKITTNVKSVTFGLSRDYRHIANHYPATLVTENQDTPVYAYYVNNSGKYDLYFLANDVIYTPTDCSNLCNGMSNLVSVDTTNLDVSRTTSMYRMFRDCGKLAKLDVSNWDTSNVTNMRDLFRGCKSLPSVDVSNWETGKVETLIATFQDCILMTEIDVSDWNTSNVTDMTQTFNRCNALKKLDVSKWDTSKVTSMQLMFQECLVLPSLDVSNWNTGKVTSMGGMFRGCGALKALDVSEWNVSQVANFSQIFASNTSNTGKMKFKTLDVSKWNTSSATNMGSVFYGCGQLTELDLSGWNVSNVTNMSHMFADCFKLQSINFTGWDTSSLEIMDAMFNNCNVIVTLDVSDFDTHNVKEFCQVFEACGKLEKIIGLNKWNTANGCVFEEMFSGCSSLKELDLSSFDTRNARDNFKGASDTYHAFNGAGPMFRNLSSLEKLILGENFDFNGNSDSNRPVVLPNPANIDGQATKWYNLENDTYYTASEIPEMTAATYIAAGATMRNSLHYLNGDKTQTKITDKVNTVTFGLKANHQDIVNNNTGVMMNVEQDTPAYVYYILNNGKYDLYFLSNDVIYTPKNSTGLFMDMKVLTSVDTTNLNTSRTEIFSSLMKGCVALTQVIGVENWNTEKAILMDEVFNNCQKLDNLDLRNWYMVNVTNMKNMFRWCYALKNFDASTWYLPNVGDMAQVFLNCKSLEELHINNWRLGSAWRTYATFGSCENLRVLDIADWDMSSITVMSGMFQFCGKLEAVDVSQWDVSSVTDMDNVFRCCFSLTELDVSNWDVSSVIKFNSMFSGTSNAGDMNIKYLDVSNWQPTSVVYMNHMFYGCAQLTELDMSGWNMPNLYTTSHMFADCNKLKVIDVSGWKTTGTWYSMDAMFNECYALKELDVSSWNTSGMVEYSQAFENCTGLVEIKGMDKLDTTNACCFYETFLNCRSLKVMDLTGFSTQNLRDGFKHINGDKTKGFQSTFSGVTGLEKLILGKNFSLNGNGATTVAAVLPNPAPIDGQATKWYNAANDTYYDASEIPEPNGETVIYIAAVPPVNP